MSLQLLVRHATFDDASFDSDAENRATAGLTLLQRWFEPQGAAHWLLYQVSDQPRAQGWLEKSAALGHAPADAHFLQTAS
ncbi:hypothetical protein AL036_00395 [Salipiger aestuarii]|uniref:Uncharacterized protein n=1 Tax=Salipiger aestuarii TaxID=568098 RepID=A0A327YLT3_9RHOB|nr:hypothetical protein [Salipiger aestuarii]EIE48865.1 hypothetical protein C357_21935 [Citreicella sp. 357]KAA8610379.1 hypothetical protein AL036_00395 [Salipiger aestuarii]KAA8616395.1 hypothetical protein AL037_00395 [Salipiger aestuarii]KAB2543510.1 hypothetical protein AL035_01595 [Salipiger aestuarii]RAK21923.1 hypothetical protein ATI53_100379 [Salipiger aestuarii]